MRTRKKNSPINRSATAAADEALAAPLSGLPGPRGKANEGSDLTPVQHPELRQLGDHGSRDGRTDAGDGRQEFLLCAPDRRAPDSLTDILVETGELLLESPEQTGDAALAAGRSPLLALALGDDHLDDLTPAGDEVGERWVLGSGSAPDLGWWPRKRAITAASIGSVLARCRAPGRSPHLRRVDHHHRQARQTPERRRPRVSKPPVASMATSIGRGPQLFAQLRQTLPSRLATSVLPSGRTCTSSRSLETSMPTILLVISITTLPCLIGLRLRPRRLFGFDGTTVGGSR